MTVEFKSNVEGLQFHRITRRFNKWPVTNCATRYVATAPVERATKKDLAVTVQANWRITIRFVSGNAEMVDFEDYH